MKKVGFMLKRSDQKTAKVKKRLVLVWSEDGKSLVINGIVKRMLGIKLASAQKGKKK